MNEPQTATLYATQTPNSQRVAIALHELSIPHQICLIGMRAGVASAASLHPPSMTRA